MRIFIHSENQQIALLLSKRYKTYNLKGSVVYIKKTSNSILSISTLPEDVFVIDTHSGGVMTDLKGIELSYKLITRNKNIPKVIAYSWFSHEYLLKKNVAYRYLVNNENFELIQLPNL